uniref:Peptidase_M10 domain-containing protein n=1 Tax=Gongylonema pulchrum TaxID=637853 RepID=A0A183D4G4_9BILA
LSRNISWQAFEKWSKLSAGPLAFEDRSPARRDARKSNAHFDILFAKYAHGDKESFDGLAGIVAHSAYPKEGIIHFDGSEFWSVNGRSGLELRYVALHGIGPALGLRHSRDPRAVMNPYYRFIH